MEPTEACPICSLTDILVTAPGQLECVTCGHEWASEEADAGDERVVHDANGNVLRNGDTVSLVKDLKLKGTSSTIKVGTRISGIRIVAGDHEIDCKVDGRPILLKAQYLKKV